MKRDDSVYVRHILDAIAKVEMYLGGRVERKGGLTSRSCANACWSCPSTGAERDSPRMHRSSSADAIALHAVGGELDLGHWDGETRDFLQTLDD